MKIELENSYLVPSINLLQSLKLKGAQSIARSKLVKLLTKSLESLQEAEQSLINEYGEREDNSKPVGDDNPLMHSSDGNAKLQPDRLEEYRTEHNKLMKEVAEIEGGTYVNHIDDVSHIIDDYANDTELDGADAEAYFALHEAFEDAKNNK